MGREEIVKSVGGVAADRKWNFHFTVSVMWKIPLKRIVKSHQRQQISAAISLCLSMINGQSTFPGELRTLLDHKISFSDLRLSLEMFF